MNTASPSQIEPSGPPVIGWSAQLGRRIGFALAVLLVVRLGQKIPLPGLDPAMVATFFHEQTTSQPGFGMGHDATARLSIFALGLTPFVSAWVLMEVFRGRRSNDAVGRYRRWLTMLFAAFQALGIAHALEGVRGLVLEPGAAFRISTMLSLSAGTLVLMWLGEQITRRGICDGIWLIIAGETIASLPGGIAAIVQLQASQIMDARVWLVAGGFVLAAVALIVLVETARRPVAIRYGAAGSEGALVFRIDHATVLPIYLASLVVAMPAVLSGEYAASTTSGTVGLVGLFGRGQVFYLFVYGALIALFAYVMTAKVRSPRDILHRVWQSGGQIAGVPEAEAPKYIEGMLKRLTFMCAVYLTALALLPEVLIAVGTLPIHLGGANLLIVVIVMLDILHLSRTTVSHSEP